MIASGTAASSLSTPAGQRSRALISRARSTEASISTALGIGRTPVHQAIDRLMLDGLLDVISARATKPLAFISSTEKKTVPVAVLTELVQGDVYHWGSLMAGALLGSLPVAIFYMFFVEYYVSSLTGAVKE